VNGTVRKECGHARNRRVVQRGVRAAGMEEAAVLGGGRPVAGVAIGADIVEVEGSHVIMICQPQALTDHILKAARAVAGSPR
jgi:hypothetical protein